VLAMRYIERILKPGEIVLYSGRIHRIIYLPAIIMRLLALAALVALTQMRTRAVELSWMFIAGAFALGAYVMLASAWFNRSTTEIDVINRRIVYKRGVIKRRTVEMNMDKVATVDVDQSVFGRLMNYGDITIHSTGTEFEPLHGIDACSNSATT